MIEHRHRALYAAFDRFPSRKGAAIHIDRFARALFDEADGGLLYVLGSEQLPARQIEANGIEIVRFTPSIDNFLDRALRFGDQLARIVDELEPSLEIAHFRDPWSGAAIALRPQRKYAVVYEVNAFPSIELPYLFPAVAPRTLEKIRATELACCANADLIVTPSQTTAHFLEALGVDRVKTRVIPNGADLQPPRERPENAPRDYLLYFGSPQSWQGVDALLRAFARLADFTELRLVICGSRRSKGWRRHERLAAKLRVDERILWHFELEGNALAAWLQHATISVAPLTDSPRNVLQGCAPLKIVEAMAAGVPVVASDVPPVRELIRDRENGWLVHPDRPSELARALRILLDRRDLAHELGERGRRTIEETFTWDRATNALRTEYRALLRRGVDSNGSDRRLSFADR